MEKCTTISTGGRTKNVMRQGHYGLRSVFGIFFGLKKAFGLPQAKKIPNTKAKMTLPKHNFVAIPNDEICHALTCE